jgi:hypothetical protein
VKERKLEGNRSVIREDGLNGDMSGEPEKRREKNFGRDIAEDDVRLTRNDGWVEIDVERQNVYYSVTDGEENIIEGNDFCKKSISVIGQHYENCHVSNNDVYENMD